jgi:hypothetical protein
MGRDESREGFRRGVILCFSFRGDWRFCFFFWSREGEVPSGHSKAEDIA